MTKDRELRFSTGPLEFRDGDDNTVTVSGYAAVFDEETQIGGKAWGYREVIRSGAFKSALERGDDVLFLVNHGGLPLARSTSGTLKLSEDKRGLKMETELDLSDPDVAQIVPKMRRGDLTKMSFAFLPDEEKWTRNNEDDDDEMPLREILDVQLFDVAIVTEPAYAGTEIGLRAFERYREQHSGNAAAVRARMKLKLGATA